MEWIASLEAALPELADRIKPEAPPHEQIEPLSTWVQSAIQSDDLAAAGRGFDWAETQLQTSSDLQRNLTIYFVSMLHFTGMERARRNEFFQRMPPTLFRSWLQLNQAIDAAHELE